MAQNESLSRPREESIQRVAAFQVLVLSGPNLDRLGRREPDIYGSTTLDDVHKMLQELASSRAATCSCRQSNHEGQLIDWVGGASDEGFHGIVFNPGAYTHTSYALYDAVRSAEVPTIEVHISNPDSREGFRRRSRIAPACFGRIAGFGIRSYALGLIGLLDQLAERRG